MLRTFVVLVVLASMLSAFPVDVVKQFPSTINTSGNVQAEYHVLMNRSVAYNAFVKFGQAVPSGSKIFLGNDACALNQSTFVCNGWFGQGNNYPKINISLITAVPGNLDVSVWFELVQPVVAVAPPPAPKPNVTVVPPAPKPTPPPTSNPTPIVVTPQSKPVVPNISKVIMNVADSNSSSNSTKVPTPLSSPSEDDSIVIAAAILIIGGGIVWWFL